MQTDSYKYGLAVIALLIACGTGSRAGPQLWSPTESTALAICRDSLRSRPSSTCHTVLTDGFFQASSDSTGQLTVIRTWHVSASQLDSAFVFQQERLTDLLGQPRDTVSNSHDAWNGNVSLWRHGPDTSPVDSSQKLWGVVLVQGPHD